MYGGEEGVKAKRTLAYKGEGGPKNSQFLAYVLNGRPLYGNMSIPIICQIQIWGSFSESEVLAGRRQRKVRPSCVSIHILVQLNACFRITLYPLSDKLEKLHKWLSPIVYVNQELK